MTDTIIIVVEKCLIALFAVMGYFYLVCSLIPHLTLRPSWREEASHARGLSRVVFATGRGVVYEPDLSMRRYIRQYALVLHDGQKFLQCCIHPRVTYLRYDIISFGQGGELLDIVRVCERPTVPGQTARVRLPVATAHAYVVLRRADGMYRNNRKLVRYAPWRLLLLVGLTVAATVAAACLLHDAVARVWALCYPSLPTAKLGTTLVAAAVMGLFCSGWILLRHTYGSGKAVNT